MLALVPHAYGEEAKVGSQRNRHEELRASSGHLSLQSDTFIPYEPVHEISNKVVCATSKASDQPAHMRSLIRAFASRLSIL